MKALAAILLCAASVAQAHVLDVVSVRGGYVMLTDDRAPSGMPLFRSFDSDGNAVEIGGYVPSYTGYTVHSPRGQFELQRGNAVARRQLHDALDTHCRGDSGDDPKTQRACQLRDQLEF